MREGNPERSVLFHWDPDDFDRLVESAARDDGVRLSIRYLSEKKARILDAGCGSGRVVKYLHDLGYRNVSGIELNEEAVRHVNRTHPELDIVTGNILDMPYEECSFDAVLSFGVLEHFPGGLDEPMRAIRKVLRYGGVAVVTVPSLNKIRGLIDRTYLEILIPRNWKQIRKSRSAERRATEVCRYSVFPKWGNFFEYRLTKKEFEEECRNAGFELLESIPIAHIDGLYHLFGRMFVKYDRWHFDVGWLGDLVNRAMTRFPFLHNHMHACVLRKPAPL